MKNQLLFGSLSLLFFTGCSGDLSRAPSSGPTSLQVPDQSPTQAPTAAPIPVPANGQNSASPVGPIQAVTLCPYPSTSSSDGCANANANAIFLAPSLASFAQSGQALLHRPARNIPGIEYRVGYDQTLKLRDPNADQGALPQGCFYDATGASTNGRHSGPTVSCGTNQAKPFVGGSLSGWDFTQNNCTWLWIGGASSGTITISNNHFGTGANCASLMDMYADLKVNVVFSHNEVENLFNSTKVLAALNSLAFSNMGTQGGTHCTTSITYNYIHDLSGNFAAGNSAWCTVELAYNVLTDFNLGPSTHGAFFANSPTGGTAASPIGVDQLSYHDNLIVYTAKSGNGTTALSVLGHQGGYTYYSKALAQNNTIITNLNHGQTTTAAALLEVLRNMFIGSMIITDNFVDPTGALTCLTNNGDGGAFTGTIDNGSGGSGSTLTVTSASPAIYPGAAFGNPTGDVIYGYIAPYGTVSSDTGFATTGTGANGTYALCADSACMAGPAMPTKQVANGWSTLTSPTYSLTATGNINMVTGGAITVLGPKWGSGACH